MTEKNIYRNTAWIYDIEHGGNRAPMPDVPFYREYAAKQCGESGEKGEILELGCGTGRVALALAKEGFRVTGLDLSSQMLDIFREKLAKQPELSARVEIIHGDMTDFSIGRKFALITAPFRVFQLLVTEHGAKNALACIKEHLADDGIFILNVFNPFKDSLDETWCNEEVHVGDITHEETGTHIARYECRERIDTANQIIYPYLAYNVTYPDGTTQRLVEPLQMKYYYSPQLRTLVEGAGFEILEEFTWYDKTLPVSQQTQFQPTQPTSEQDANHPNNRPRGREIIFVCRRAPQC